MDIVHVLMSRSTFYWSFLFAIWNLCISYSCVIVGTGTFVPRCVGNFDIKID
jgi:hypothetical protein